MRLDAKVPIIDASIVIAAILDDETSELAVDLLHEVASAGAVVPSLFWYELRNVLLLAIARQRASEGSVVSKLRDLRALNIYVAVEPSDEDVFRLARDHSLTAYDAAYAALAIRENRPLATLDKALIRAGQAGAFELWSATSARRT